MLRRYSLLGIPTRAGCLLPGTESAPASLRKAKLLKALQAKGLDVQDRGDLSLPRLRRHDRPPIRNFPSPRDVWTATLPRVKALLKRGFPILLGGDCSIVVGTAGAGVDLYGDRLRLLYIDGHMDSIAPHKSRCQGAAGMGLWFLTKPSPFWRRRGLRKDQVLVFGVSNRLQSGQESFRHWDAKKIRALEPGRAAKQVIATLGSEDKIFVHWDVDVIRRQEMPAAYAPNSRGLRLNEARKALKEFLKDSRVIGMEITEFNASKDHGGACARRIVDLLLDVLPAQSDD